VFNGIGANLELAGPMIARLDAIETVIFDVPGAGKSPPPKFPYRLFMLARLARKLLDELGIGQVDVMGVSWGGGLARSSRSSIRSVCAAWCWRPPPWSPPAMWPGPSARSAEDAHPQRYRDKGYMKRVAPELYGGELRTRPEAIQLFTDHARAGNPTGYRYQMLALLGWTSLPWLWRIRHPTLILAGNDDPLVPLINARLQAWLLRDARLHVIADGHLFLLTRAQETASVIGTFLAAARH
jgi:poly(3-hydroxyalkanoate) depolymerase